MNDIQLVIEQDGKAVTDSLKIAEVFGKDHKRVLQDIRDLDCSQEFRERSFVLSSYFTIQNKEMPKYYISQDGFTFLVMGYTGKNAAMYKESYIREFNHLRDQLQQISPANNYLSMSDEDRAIAYFTELKVKKQRQLKLNYQNNEI